MGQYKKLWYLLIAVLVVAFTLLGFAGREVYRHAPPFPSVVQTSSGEVLFTKDNILHGQTAWQSTGGMEVGSILGHGAYQAPDWTADWLHRELSAWLDLTAQERFGTTYDKLTIENQAALRAALKAEYNEGGKPDANDRVTVSDTRAKAIKETAKYYVALYGDDPAFATTREHFAMKANTLAGESDRQDMTAFFFWTAWASSTNRPDTDATYTNNWPHEPLIENVPTTENVIWSVVSIVVLLFGIGLMIWGYSWQKGHDEVKVPSADPLSRLSLTPSQKALWKYVALTGVLFLVQVMLGGFVAHYTIEGGGFYGIDTSEFFPYSLARTWHIQSAIFWIATGFLTAGLFLAPIINGGKDPKFQRFGVNLLFVALLIVAGGSFAGNYVAIAQTLPKHLNFWFGHQGYEFLDIGRFWQLMLFVGLLLWLFLMLRCTVNALKNKDSDRNLLAIFIASMVGVGLFYGPGLFYGEHTSLTVMEYWRWWVVHLWVEGFFELFATAAIAFVFYNLGLVRLRTATVSTLAAASIFLIGGVPGTMHHLYFSGVTSVGMGMGAVFSALEVVPLVLLGYEAYEHWSYQHAAPWAKRLRWPVMCFVAVAFWNMLGAGVFGFLINPPISLFYLQGLNTTAVHSHSALFGVYGFLALGFIFLVTNYLKPKAEYSPMLMAPGFWLLNVGLVLMIVTSLLPIGIIQASASISEGLWYARSEEVMQSLALVNLRWLRILGDTVFIVGAFMVVIQAFKLIFSPRE